MNIKCSNIAWQKLLEQVRKNTRKTSKKSWNFSNNSGHSEKNKHC